MADSIGQLLALAVGLMVWVANATALTVPPLESRTQISRDGRYVLVMLVNEWHQPSPQEAEKICRIHKDYPKSGLYRNDGSTELLWEFSRDFVHVEIATDGVHLLYPTYRARSPDDEAFSIYAKGQLIRTWYVRELVSPTWKPRMDSPPLDKWFQWARETHFDDDRLSYSVETEEGNRYTFDVRSGEMIERIEAAASIPTRDPEELRKLRFAVALILITLVGIVSLAIWRRLLQRRRQSTRETVPPGPTA